MRISDWSSDVCSSDLRAQARQARQIAQADVLGEVCFDVVGDAPQAQRAESADHRRRPAEPIAIGTEDMHSERRSQPFRVKPPARAAFGQFRSEEHTSELQSLMRTSYAVFCLKKKNKQT